MRVLLTSDVIFQLAPSNMTISTRILHTQTVTKLHVKSTSGDEDTEEKEVNENAILCNRVCVAQHDE